MSITLRVILTCVKHPTYRGIGKPRSKGCNCCEAIWSARHNTNEFSDSVFGADDTRVHIQVMDDGQDAIH